MKKRVLHTLIAFSSSYFAHAQWLPVNGPSGGIAQCVVAVGDTVVAGTSEGVFQSIDAGGIWTKSTVGITQKNINALLVKDKKIYAVTDQGTSTGGLFVSTNYGSSWTALTTSGFSTYPNSIAIDGNTIYLGTSKSGIYVSTNGGTSFIPSNTGLGNLNIYGLLVKEGTVFAATENGVYTSTNNGASWALAGTGIPNLTTMRAFAVSGNTLFASSNYYLYASTNNGANWTQFPTTITGVYAMLVDGDKVYAAGDGKIFLSTNNTSFSQINTSGIPAATNITGIALGKGALYSAGGLLGGSAVNGGVGVFKSTNGGVSWALANKGITLKVNTIFNQGSTVYVGTNGGAFVSSNAGATWAEINTNLQNRSVRSIGMSGTNLIVAASAPYYSSNNGSTWTMMNKTTKPSGGLAFSSNAIFAAEQSAVKRTLDLGATNWTTGVGSPTVLPIAITATGKNVYVGTSFNGLYRSLDEGANWTAATTGITGSGIYAVASDGPRTFAGSGGGGIFYSPDSAKTWKAASVGLSPGVTAYAIFLHEDGVFAGSLAGELFYSNNNGTTWNNVSTGLKGSTIHSIGTDGTYLYAGSLHDGLFKRPLSEIKAAASVPTAVTTPTVAVLSETEVKLTWQDNAANEDKFIIEQSTSLAGPWIKAGEVNANTNTFTVTGLSPETPYLFRVLGSNAAGNSSLSPLVGATTNKPITTGLEEKTLTNVRLYPNPTTGILHVAVQGNDFPSISLLDAAGKEVLAEEATANTTLQLGDLKEGLYFLQLKTSQGTRTEKILLQK